MVSSVDWLMLYSAMPIKSLFRSKCPKTSARERSSPYGNCKNSGSNYYRDYSSHKAGNGMDAVVNFSQYMTSSTTHDSFTMLIQFHGLGYKSIPKIQLFWRGCLNEYVGSRGIQACPTYHAYYLCTQAIRGFTMSGCAVRECENTCIVLHFISNSFTLSKRTTLVNNLKTFAITITLLIL